MGLDLYLSARILKTHPCADSGLFQTGRCDPTLTVIAFPGELHPQRDPLNETHSE